MASRKRKRGEIDRDRRILSQWLAMGKMDTMSQVEAADKLRETTNAGYTLSQQQISYDLTYIEKQWKKDQIENIHKAKMRELEKLKGYEREYLIGWERSIKEKEKHKRKVKNEEGERSKEIQVETEERVGNPRFLDGLLKVSQLRAKLLGYEAPQKHELTGEDGGPIEITEVEVVKTRNE